MASSSKSVRALSILVVFVMATMSVAICAELATATKNENDYLNISALKSDKAHRALLLDITITGKRLVAVGERGTVVYSDDNGTSWNQADVPVYSTLTSIDFASESLGIAVGHDGVVLRTQDAGQSWEKVFDGYRAMEQILVRNRLLLAEAEQNIREFNASKSADEMLSDKPLNEHVAESDAEIEKLEEWLADAQYNLEIIETDIQHGPAWPFLDVFFANELEGWAVGAYGMVFRTNDSGLTWNSWGDRLPNQEGAHLNSVSVTGMGMLIIVGEGAFVARSNDGDSWERMETPYYGSYYDVLTGTDSETQKDWVVIAGFKGNLYRSTDSGVNWDKLEVDSEKSLLAADKRDDGSIAVVGASGIVRYGSDIESNLMPIDSGSRASLSGVVIGPDDNLFVVGFGGVRRLSLEQIK
ncbi:MAG: YCF48-related protein [Candidatus Thiodiazotropha endolucinida]